MIDPDALDVSDVFGCAFPAVAHCRGSAARGFASAPEGETARGRVSNREHRMPRIDLQRSRIVLLPSFWFGMDAFFSSLFPTAKRGTDPIMHFPSITFDYSDKTLPVFGWLLPLDRSR